jgi:hypothetical protein
MSYISADDYYIADKIMEVNNNVISMNESYNCNNNDCPDGYSCVNNICSPTDINVIRNIPFKSTPIIDSKKVFLNSNVYEVPIGVPMVNTISDNLFSFKSSGDLFQSCNVDSDCMAGYWCLNAPDNMNLNSPTVCLSSGKNNVGQSCKDGRDCLVGLDCYNTVGADSLPTKQCLMSDPNPTNLITGATCANNNNCKSNSCVNNMCV